jgi:catalase
VLGVDGNAIEADATLEAAPSTLFDAVVLPEGGGAIEVLRGIGLAVEFVKDQYRHCKPMLVLGHGLELLAAAGIPPKLPNGEPDPGLMQIPVQDRAPLERFIAAVAMHRHFERQVDPPVV